MSSLAKIIATFLGIGYAPIAPGTAASLVTVLLYKFFLCKLSWPAMLVIMLLVYVIGVWAASKYSREKRLEDPRTVVIDEVLGQLLALFLLNPTWPLMLAAFLLFRIFDVIKPLFISRAERFSSGWGIMLDDIIAGLYSSILINIFLLIR